MKSNFFFKTTIAAMLAFGLLGTAYGQSSGDVRDGVNGQIDAASISDLLSWAQNSQIKLEKGLLEVAKLPQPQKRKFLRNLVDSVIEKSADMREELLMRSVLRRARNFDSLIGANLQSDSAGEVLAVNFMTEAAAWAIQLYPTEKAYLRGLEDYYRSRNTAAAPKNLEFADLGLKSTRKVLDALYLSPSVDISLALLKETLTYLYNDINRDLMARRDMAPALLSILEQAVSIGIMDDKGVSVPTAVWIDQLKGLSVAEKLNLERSLKTFLDGLLGAPKTDLQNEYLNKVKRIYPPAGSEGAKKSPSDEYAKYRQTQMISKIRVGAVAGTQNEVEGTNQNSAAITVKYFFAKLWDPYNDYAGQIAVSGTSNFGTGYNKLSASAVAFPVIGSGMGEISSNKVGKVLYRSAWAGGGLNYYRISAKRPVTGGGVLEYVVFFPTVGMSPVPADLQLAMGVPKYMQGARLLGRVESDKTSLSAECRFATAGNADLTLCMAEFEKVVFRNLALQINAQHLLNPTTESLKLILPTQINIGVSVNAGGLGMVAKYVGSKLF